MFVTSTWDTAGRKKRRQITIPAHQFWWLVRFFDCSRPVRFFVRFHSELSLVQRPTNLLKCDMLSFLLLQSSAWYDKQGASFWTLQVYLGFDPQVRAARTATLVMLNSMKNQLTLIGQAEASMAFFCYVSPSSPRSLNFYVAPQITFKFIYLRVMTLPAE